MMQVCRLILLFGWLTLCSTSLAQDYEELIRQAVEQRNNGELAGAEASLRAAWPLSEDKREVAYLLGMVLAFQERYAEARELVQTYLQAYPDDTSLREALTSIDTWRSGAPLPDPATGLLRNQLAFGFNRSTFSLPGFADWNDRQVEYRRLSDNGDSMAVRLNRLHRFGSSDTQLELQTLVRQRQDWPVELGFGYTPDADFVADHYLQFGTRLPLSGGATGTATAIVVPTYRYSSFGNGDTHRLLLGMEYYFSGVDAWLTPSLGLVRDQDGQESTSWGLAAHWQVSARNRVGAGYSDAPETENLLTVDTRALMVYWRADLNNRWQLQCTANRLEREGSYDRNEYSLVLQYRF